MNLIKAKCTFCGKEFLRTLGQVNEAKKFGWNQYCSIKCHGQTKLRRIERTCANLNCNEKISRELNQFKKSVSGRIFCSLSCAASVNNSEFPKRKKRVRECNYCSKKFSGDGKNYCSKKCKDNAQIISKEDLCEQIKEFYKRNKRIPFKRESHHYTAARLRFGTWNKAIKSAGFKPNPVMFAKKHTANDKHICDSLAEKIIDDWLYARKIKHRINVPYPGDESLTADFVTKDNWIEFLGLVGVINKYDRLVERKRRLVKRYKLPLIEIYPKDLFPINNLKKIIKNI